jgi:hypothetical protein
VTQNSQQLGGLSSHLLFLLYKKVILVYTLPMTIFNRIESKPDFFENLNHILNFQINDLRRGLELAKANFLVAVGCMNTIEFLGGLRNGELGMKGKSESRFKEGVRLLGENYGVRFLFPEMVPADDDVMWALRCGLTHQYLPRVKRVGFIFIGAGKVEPYRPFGIIERENSISRIEPPLLMVDVASLIEAIERGYKTLITELKSDEQKKSRAEKALSLIPELI